MDIRVDLEAAKKLMGELYGLPHATNHIINQWAADTVAMLKRRASGMKKSGAGRKTGHMARNIGMTNLKGQGQRELVIGTGVGNTKEVVYARIQDKGGEIKAKKKYLTIPFPGVMGSARDYVGAFFIKSKTGKLMLCERKGKGGIRPLFLLKTSVKIPPTEWFSGIVNPRVRDLDELLTPDNVVKTAQNMAGGD